MTSNPPTGDLPEASSEAEAPQQTPAPTPEAYTAPQPPPYAPQTPPPYSGPPGYAAASTTQRPGMVTAAGITMIVIGALGAIFGLILLLGGVFISGVGSSAFANQPPEFAGIAGAIGGVIIVLALIVVAVGILDIVAGGYVLAGRAWARITGIVVSAVLAVLWGLSLLGDNRGGVLIGLVLLLANAFVIWALATTGAWFATRRT